MKARIFVAVVIGTVLVAMIVNGQPAKASITPILAIDNVVTALNSGDVDTVMASFADNAVVENQVRGRKYSSKSEIRRMLEEEHRPGRRFEVVGISMNGDTVVARVEVSDRGIVWGSETIKAEVKDGKFESFYVAAFRLELWGHGS